MFYNTERVKTSENSKHLDAISIQVARRAFDNQITHLEAPEDTR